MVFRILNGLMGVYFVYATVVQYNDPDWLRWMLIYGACAVMCFQAAANQGQWRVPAVIGAIALVWALIWMPGVLAHPPGTQALMQYRMLNVEVEETREMLGLFISAFWMGVIASVRLLRLRRRSAAARAEATSRPS